MDLSTIAPVLKNAKSTRNENFKPFLTWGVGRNLTDLELKNRK